MPSISPPQRIVYMYKVCMNARLENSIPRFPFSPSNKRNIAMPSQCIICKTPMYASLKGSLSPDANPLDAFVE